MNDTQHTKAVQYGRAAGYEAGRDADSADAEPDLSGEWADTLTGPMLVSDAMEVAGIDEADPEADSLFADVTDAYEDAFYEALHDRWAVA
jgi:2-oxo-4-hydroxy-4-carboxy--5-ureidoimidazoline (OHCU) decarboxylase